MHLQHCATNRQYPVIGHKQQSIEGPCAAFNGQYVDGPAVPRSRSSAPYMPRPDGLGPPGGWQSQQPQQQYMGQGNRQSFRPNPSSRGPPGGRFGGLGGQGRGRGNPDRRRDAQRSPSPAPPFKMVLKAPLGQPQPEDNELRTGLSVTWLGTSSGAPTLERNVSCTVVRTQQDTAVVDCGEGSARQLAASGIPLSTINCIYVTHLHGDHCFGLGNTLAAIDTSKVAAARAELALQGTQLSGDGQQEVEALRQVSSPTFVWGPPGTAELLCAQLVLTGVHKSLVNDVLVTELVVNASDEVLRPESLSSSCSRIAVRRLAARPTAESAGLVAASRVVTPALDQIPLVYVPRGRGHRRVPRLPSDRQSLDDESGTEDELSEVTYGGRNYVAAEGLVWSVDPPAASHAGQRRRHEPSMRCMAAQLQHRVPCWGYVMREAQPAAEGAACRKVVILGDTVNSRPIGPLALGCDLLAHEATFTQGMEDKCRMAQHSTGWMAGSFAAAVQARLLVLTHFSARYQQHSESFTPGHRMRERELTAEEELAEQSMAVKGLVREAQAHYDKGRIIAASDLYTVHVPMRSATSGAPAQQQVGHSSRVEARRSTPDLVPV